MAIFSSELWAKELLKYVSDCSAAVTQRITDMDARMMDELTAKVKAALEQEITRQGAMPPAWSEVPQIDLDKLSAVVTRELAKEVALKALFPKEDRVFVGSGSAIPTSGAHQHQSSAGGSGGAYRGSPPNPITSHWPKRSSPGKI